MCMFRQVLPFLTLLLAVACAPEVPAVTQQLPGADPLAGRDAIQSYGCGGCHTIPGVENANARVGPSLQGIARQSYLAGKLPNTAENLVRWIQDPQGIDPGVAMPDLGVSADQARDIAAYLYSVGR
jgi:cytochrome c2